MHRAVASVQLRRRRHGGELSRPADKVFGDDGTLSSIPATLPDLRRLPRRLDTDPERVERGLAQLVLTLIELVRQLMERQALRRIEHGSVNDEEIERLGQTFMKLEARMAELKRDFGLDDDDLNLNLGPLGDLLE